MMNFMVMRTIEWNESEMNDRAAIWTLAIQWDAGILFLYLCSHEIVHLLPEKSRSMTELNEVKRNFDGSLKAS